MNASTVLTVSQLTSQIKQLLETHPSFSQIILRGEVSNLTAHSSGHLYFTLKDAGAQIQAVMFRNHAQQSRHKNLRPGDQVQVTGVLNVYPPRGNYQLMVYEMEAAGQGHLYEQFLKLKDRLNEAGLFDEKRKRSLPRFPRCIGIITSPTGAVIQDVINTIRRRYPMLKLLILPAAVQGVEALPSLLQAFEQVERLPQIEAVILARGGGSIEDLWAFNEEGLAAAIAACTRPVISAIGHETDFTIADFVADVRAPTPTAAAELVTRDRSDLRDELMNANRTLSALLTNRLLNEHQRLDELQTRMQRQMGHHLEKHKLLLSQLRESLRQRMEMRLMQERSGVDVHASLMQSVAFARLSSERNQLERLYGHLRSFNTEAMFELGYSLTFADGSPIRDIDPEDLAGKTLATYYANGKTISIVENEASA